MKPKQQEELTGCDVEGHGVRAESVGGVTESCKVRGDLDADHTLKDALCIRFRFCIRNLAQKRKTVNTKVSLSSAQVTFKIRSTYNFNCLLIDSR